MTALLLPFAKRNSDGELVSPEEVSRGLACDCRCPGCDHPVQARQGTEKVWHFAHAKACDCHNGYEISVHELAKQLIRQQKRALIPVLHAHAEAWDAFGQRLTEQGRVFDASIVQLDSCELSRTRELEGGPVTPDITGQAKGREILIEITVFHRLMPEKQDRLLQTGVACMQIDLSQFKTIQATRERLTAALFDDAANRLWLYHPREASAVVELKTRLETRIQDSIERKRAQDVRQAEIDAQVAQQREAELNAYHRAVERMSAITETPSGSAALPVLRYRMQWRACFPESEQVASAKATLMRRTGCQASEIEQTIGSIQNRGQLARTTPELLAD